MSAGSTKNRNLTLFIAILVISVVISSGILIVLAPRGVMLIAERRFTKVPEITNEGKAPLNSISHVNRFPTADDKIIVRPNADTFYSSGWYDLKDSAWVMNIPESDGRYYSVQFNDMWTNAFEYAGKRVDGDEAVTCLITGPGWSGEVPAGMRHIDCTSSKIWIIVRTMVFGADDQSYVREFQNGITINRYQ